MDAVMTGLAALIKEKKPTQNPSAQNGRAIVDMKVKPLLLVIKKIMHLATTDISGVVPLEDPQALDQKILSKISSGKMHDLLVDTVAKISCEISCNCSDVQTTTQTIIETLSDYTLETQIVITLVAFAVNYGNFWLVSRLYQKDELVKYVALLQQLPSVAEPVDTLKLKLKALIDVIKAVLDTTDCIFEFKDLPSQFISPDTPVLSKAILHIHQAVFVIIKSVVICSSHTTEFIRSKIMDTSHVELELSNQRLAVISVHEKLKAQLVLCQNHVAATKHTFAFEKYVKLFEATYINNLHVVTAMFSADNHESLLIDSNKHTIDVGKLKGKNVLLFISDLDVNPDDLSHFHQPWKDEKMEYQFVWVPMVDESIEWTKELQNQCSEKLKSLPWHLVCDPTKLNRGLIRYIKEVWHFKYGKPQLVEIDHLGRVVSHNAIHERRILSFLPNGEWKEVSWSIQFLAASSFDPWISRWVKAGEIFVCMEATTFSGLKNSRKKLRHLKEKPTEKLVCCM